MTALHLFAAVVLGACGGMGALATASAVASRNLTLKRKETMIANRYCPLCAARLDERAETDNMTGRPSTRLACPNGCWKGRGHQDAAGAVGELDDAYRRLTPDNTLKEHQ